MSAVDLGQDVIREAKNVEKATIPAPESRKRMDLSHMTDQQLREKINRELLERQYNDIFNKPAPPKVSRGHQVVNDILTYGGATLAAGSTALSIALAIKQLKG